MANPKKPALRLRVGGVYKSREGKRVRIVGRFGADPLFPYTDKYGVSYAKGGQWHPDPLFPYRDLVREVSAPKPARKPKAAKPVMAWCPKNFQDRLMLDWVRDRKSDLSVFLNVVRVKIVEVRR